MQEQQNKRRGILSPELRAELERKRSPAEGTRAGDGTAGAQRTESLGRRKVKLSGEKRPTAQQGAGANPVPARREPFEERYRRVTTYLERGLHERVQRLRSSGRVGSVTALYNAALRQYIKRYYSE